MTAPDPRNHYMVMSCGVKKAKVKTLNKIAEALDACLIIKLQHKVE